MKTRLKAKAIALLGIVALWGCEEDVTPLRHTAPQVTFPVEETSLTAVVGDPVEFRADIESGDKLTCGWYVDGTLEASTAEMTYTFGAPGDYEVRFEARNGAGRVGKSYAVKVSDVLEMHLSVGDSTRIVRRQLDILKVMAIVDAGSDVTHKWTVDGVEKSDKAYFDTFDLPEAKVYTVAYAGTNAAGTFRKSFEVQATERPLEINFTPADTELVADFGETLTFLAAVRFGGSGIVHEWTLDGVPVGSDTKYVYECLAEGDYVISYKGVNEKDETVTHTWNVRVNPETFAGLLLADMEKGTYPTDMFSTVNEPGLSVVDNPNVSGKNQSAKVMQQKINGTHATRGFFVLKLSSVSELSKYRGIRFKYYRSTGDGYYPTIDITTQDGKTVSKLQPRKQVSTYAEWVILEYDYPAGVYATQMEICPMRDLSGNSVAAGTRTMWFDDFELFE